MDIAIHTKIYWYVLVYTVMLVHNEFIHIKGGSMKILLASNKGGVGKTTLAVQLAVLLQCHGKRVCIIKADKNNDLFDFVDTREKLGGSLVVVEQSGDLHKIIDKSSRSYEFVIVDCAGHDSEEFRTALQVCDLYLSLVKPSSDFEIGTLNDVTVTVRQAQKFNPNLKPYVVMTRVRHQRLNKAIALKKTLLSDPLFIPPTKAYISDLTVFEDACNEGVGVHEFSSGSSLGKAKAQIELLCNEVGINY